MNKNARTQNGMTLVELLVVIALFSIILCTSCFTFFNSYKDAVFLTTLHQTLAEISENRNQMMLDPSSAVSLSGLGQVHFAPYSGLSLGSSSIFFSDGIHAATISVNSEGGISY